MKQLRVYVAGPYSQGDVAQNVSNAICLADIIVTMGHIPYIPHLSHFWHFHTARPYKFWLAYDLVWLEKCDVMVALSGKSNGVNREIRYARKNKIPVHRIGGDISRFYYFDEMKQFIDKYSQAK